MGENKFIYTIDKKKFTNIRSYTDAISAQSEARKNFHTCPIIMERKKKLEGLVRECQSNSALRHHFRTSFQNRKVEFYRKIIYDILEEKTDIEKQICEITKDILFIYSEKKSELEYLDDLVNDIEARISHEEEMRESMIEDCRGCD